MKLKVKLGRNNVALWASELANLTLLSTGGDWNWNDKLGVKAFVLPEPICRNNLHNNSNVKQPLEAWTH